MPTLPSPPNHSTKTWPRFLSLALPAMGVFTLYLCASWFNGFIYDDHEVIQDQYPAHNLKNIAEIFSEPHYLNFPYYRPITRSTFALQRALPGGETPRPYHLFNAALAAAVILAAYLLLRRPCFLTSHWPALIAALWFGVHPAISECVYPAASGRETLLPALFILLAMWAWLGEGRAWQAAAVILFAVALFSKEQAAVLPVLFVLADMLGLCFRDTQKRGLQYTAIAVVAFAYLSIRHHVLHSQPLYWTVFTQPLDPVKSILYGIQTAVAPFMTLYYEPRFADWFSPALLACGLMTVIALWSLALWPLPIDELGPNHTAARAPADLEATSNSPSIPLAVTAGQKPTSLNRIALFWAAWFILLQLPTAHLFRQDADYSERYVALAIFSLPALLAAVYATKLRIRWRRAVGSAAFAWICLFAVISFLRGSFYSSDLTFCQQWAATSPEATGPYNGLGLVAQQQHSWPLAIQAYRHVLKLDPSDATAHNNLANLLADEGDFDGAAQHYEWLLSHPSSGADVAATLTNFAQLLGEHAAQTNDPTARDRARSLLEKAIALRPGYAQAHYILGVWDEAFSTAQSAMEQFKIALDLKPEFTEVKNRLATLESATGSTTR